MNDDPFPTQDSWFSPGAPTATRVAGVLAVALALLFGLAGCFAAYRAALEPDSHAANVCGRVAENEWHGCITRVAAQPPWMAGNSCWTISALLFMTGLVLIVVDARRERQ